MKEKVLLIDDEKEITDLIEVFLQNEGYQVVKTHTSHNAITIIKNECFDLAIIDVMLPDGNGFDLCKLIRQKHIYPIIILTSKTEGIDRITGLSLGADDYVTKPFLPVELVARVKAQLRRVKYYEQGNYSISEIISVAELFLNKTSQKLNDEIIKLTPTEFDILWLLCKNRGTVFSAEKLFMTIWGEKYFKNSRNTVMDKLDIFEKNCMIQTKSQSILKLFGGLDILLNKKFSHKYKQLLLLRHLIGSIGILIVLGVIYYFIVAIYDNDFYNALENTFGRELAHLIHDYESAVIVFGVVLSELMVWIIVEWYSSRKILKVMDNIDTIFDSSIDTITLPTEFSELQNWLNYLKIQNREQQRLSEIETQKKSDVLTYLAHDIRTPLASVIGYLSLLCEAPDMPSDPL